MNNEDLNQQIILVVDDTPENIGLVTEILAGKYKVKAANSGEAALKVLAKSAILPDLILLDIMMPGMDGYEVCQTIKGNPATENIPIIFLTAMTSVADEQKGFLLGAVDYITKPINPNILLSRVNAHLKVKAYSKLLENKADYLESEIALRSKQLIEAQEATILALASLAEARDTDTANHIRRTQQYIGCLADKLRGHPEFINVLTDEAIRMIFKSAPLHDIGKVGIPDRILLKPGKLTADEFEVMKKHAEIGYEALVSAEHELGCEIGYFRFAKEIALYHHEKWDGSGYPAGLEGKDIPVSARLMAVADVYDALISRRVYKEPMSHEKAVEIIRAGRGNHFDPDIVDAFLELKSCFQDIASRLADDEQTLQRKKELMVSAGFGQP